MKILEPLVFDSSPSSSLLGWTKIFRFVTLVRFESLLLYPLLPPLLFELFESLLLEVREGLRGRTVGEGPLGLTVGDDPPPLESLLFDPLLPPLPFELFE